MKFSKIVNNKKHAPKLIFFNEKKIEKDSDNFWHRKLTLKVRNRLFSIAWFRAGVDLTKYFFMKKCYFSLNQATISCGSCWKILKWYLLIIYVCIKCEHFWKHAYASISNFFRPVQSILAKIYLTYVNSEPYLRFSFGNP